MTRPEIISAIALVVSVASLLWNVWNGYVSRRGSLSINFGDGSHIVNAVMQLDRYVTAFTLHLVISNDSPTRTVTIAVFWLEVPWKDDHLRPLDDPDERGEKIYRFPCTHLEFPRDMVINHRRYGHGRLAPGETIEGMFLVYGEAEIPFDLYQGKWIPVTVVILDASGKIHKSRRLAVWPHPNGPHPEHPEPPNPLIRKES